MTSIKFLGAAGTVTGSKYLVESRHGSVLVDCGLFQGEKKLRLRNWERFPVPESAVDFVLLTHAHIDHTGYFPRLLSKGFRGQAFAARATTDLLGVLLPDSGHLQEEEAAYHNKRGTSKHKPALPLYTESDGTKAAGVVHGLPYAKPTPLGHGLLATYRRAGHILGSAHITLEIETGNGPCKVLFSGDIGRYRSPLLPDPIPIGEADYILVESTYGDRVRNFEPIPDQLARVVNDVAERSGALVVPAFAVGRTQELMYHLAKLESESKIPKLPTFVDSPSAVDVTRIYCRNPQDFDVDMAEQVASGECPLENENFFLTRSQQESKQINKHKGPLIIISASGMVTGGRILHHLRHRLPDKKNTVLLVGFQARGTRGWRLLEGEPTIRIFGEDVPVRAKVETLAGLSAHADANGLMRWLSTAERPPKEVFLVHGEPEPMAKMAERIERELGWNTRIPEYKEKVSLR